MASTLPNPADCCQETCECPTTVQVPGPEGQDGTNGVDGTDGVNPFTTITADFTIPAELATGIATVADTSWMVISQKLYGARVDGSIHAFFEISAIGGATSVTLRNLEDAATSSYLENSAPGNTLNIGSKLCPAGIQGPSGLLSGGAAGGDLKGTYPNPKISVNNTKGALLVGNGTDSVAVPVGTDGHLVKADSTDAEGLVWGKLLPLTGDTDLADNRILRADGAAGLPVPAQPSKVTVTDNGAVRADGSGGNARGTDAIDLQVTRGGATQVASGTNSTIGGGANNTASGTTSTVGGGSTNTASAISTVVAGGGANTASAITAAVCGGSTNLARSQSSFVGGGENNIAGDAGAANHRCTVGGGDTNVASGQESTIAGGNQNQATGTQSAICGGDGNTASATESTVGGGNGNTASGIQSTVAGGAGNTASGQQSCIPGGGNAIADKYGQIAWSGCNLFATQGDAQSSWFMLKNATTNATATDLFLDGTSLRATIASGKSWMFQIMLVARKDDGLTSIYKSEGLITNVAGTTSMPAAATTTEIYDGITLPATPVVVTADNANDSINIQVTGVVGTNIRWVARVAIVEVSY